MNYKLIFGKGTEINDLAINATTLISREDIRSILADDKEMKTVRLIETDDDGNSIETVYEYAKTSGAYLKTDGWNFTIWGSSPDEIALIKLKESSEMVEDAIAELAEIIGGIE